MHKHAATRLHYDLRLEQGGVLLSWAVPKGPSLDPDEKRLAVHVEDHPVEYAEFEGVIPADAYGGGPSIVWDRGTWVNVEGEKHGLAHGKLLFDLHGQKLKGRWTLVRTKSGAKDWLLIKKPDAFARKGEPGWPEASIYSGLDVHELPELEARRAALRAELAAAKVPRREVDPSRLELMLAERAEAPFSREGWLFELKYDGFRMIAARTARGPVLRLRGGSEASATFPELARAVAGLPCDAVLDAELVVNDERGHPSFGRLQERAHLSRRGDIDRAQVQRPATLYAFDLLALEGHDLRGLPLRERKAWLRRVLPPLGPLRYCDHVEERGAELYAEARKLGLEGVMGKRADAPWRSGRSRDWLKVRGECTGDFAVVGYTLPSGARVGMGALDLALWDGAQFRYAGSVGTGLSDRELAELRARLEPQRRKAPAFAGEGVPGKRHVWVEPTLAVEVAYFEWTQGGVLRQPRFVRLREDKPVKECVPPAPPASPPEAVAPVEPERREVAVSNPGKVFWPEDGYTKADLVAYYRAVSPWLLPYLKDRPVVLTRYPDGIGGKSFFQKDAPKFAPDWLRRVRTYSEGSERELDHFVCDDEASLAYLANLGTIPLHVWASRVATLHKPDWSILDLDPKGAPFAEVVRVAKEIRRVSELIELPSFVKTSGSSGLHVLFPLGARCSWAEARGLAELIARVVVAALPEVATIERVVSARGGKVYLDYLQNGYGKLLAAPLCVRPLPHAPVSMPLHWREVTTRNHPQAFTLKNAVRRMEKLGADPFLGVLGPAPDLVAVLQRLGERAVGRGGR